MKREGRQHGMVRVHRMSPNPLGQRPDQTRLAHRLQDGPATGRSFVHVSKKPTNHSKFTGKCGLGKGQCKECHLNPACKAKSKTKGNHKINSNDAVFTSGSGLSGKSANTALYQLASYYDRDEEHEELEDIIS